MKECLALGQAPSTKHYRIKSDPQGAALLDLGDPEAVASPTGSPQLAARSGPRFGPHSFLLLAGYENLTAPNAIMQS